MLQQEELYLEVYVQGQLAAEPHLLRFERVDDVPAIGRLRNLLHLLQAMCRFLNAGGEHITLTDSAEDIATITRSLPVFLELPPGHLLLDAIEQTTRQNLIRDPDGSVLVVTVDQWAERWSDLDLAKRVPGELVPSLFDEDLYGAQPRLQHQEDSEA